MDQAWCLLHLVPRFKHTHLQNIQIQNILYSNTDIDKNTEKWNHTWSSPHSLPVPGIALHCI